MAASRISEVVQHLRTAVLPQDGAGLTDGQLLQAYLSRREEAALAVLVQRHGPMVWGVCRRLLHHSHDAEDAFQATFLVLVRRAASIVSRDLVANWLYGVAYQTAMKARATAARRRERERQVAEMPEPDAARPDLWHDLQPLLDHELSRLPDKYRTPIVLCDLEGKTRKVAARLLGCPEGTVAGRLARARAMLARRLARHGLPISGAALAAVLAQNAASANVPASVVSATVKAAGIFGTAAAGGTLSAGAVTLVESVLRAMLMAKLRSVIAVLVVLALLGAGVTGFLHQVLGEIAADTPVAQKPVPADPPPAAKQDRDRELWEAKGIWPQWRGPNRDGVVHGVAVPEKWPRALREEWAVPVGKGVASPVVVGGNVYLLVRQKNDDEVVLCLDLQGGKEVWRSEPYPAPYKVGIGEGTADDRPRSTPAVADGRVFTLGMTGILSCFDARAGNLLWRKATKFAPYMGSSPLVADGLCIAHVGDGAKAGGLTAYDVKTGEVRWCFSDGYSAMSGSPILVDLAGERQLVTYSAWNAAGVSAATGKKLWGVGPGGGGMPCTTPLLYRDLIILADNLAPLRALRLEKGDKGTKANEVWKARADLPLYYSSPVVAADLVFGMSTRSSGSFFCLDAGSGKTLWVSDGQQGGYASLLSLGSVLLILKDRGQLLVVRPSATAFEPVAEYRVSDRATMAHPVFLGDRILIKDDLTLRSFRIEPGVAE
jgi:RNA polymerase sigma factor (sigma-70 family)